MRSKRRTSDGEVPTALASLAARGERKLVGAVLLFAAVHVAAAAFFPESAWGAHHLRFTGLPVRILWGALLVLLLVPRGRRSLGDAVRRAAGFWGRGGLLPAAAAVLLSLVAIFLFRSRNFFLGDGYLLSGILASGERYEPGHAGYGTFLLARALSHALRAAGFEAGGDVPFAVLSACSGLLLLFAASGAARELAADPVSRLAATSAVLLSGAALLFFGYVELYSPMEAFVLLYLYTGLRFLGGRSGILVPSAALVAASALHLSALALLPSWVLLVLSGQRMKRGTRAALLTGLAVVSIPVAWYIVFAVSMHREASDAVSLTGGTRAFRDLFSLAHLGFLGNLVLLGLGGVLLLLVPGREGAPEGGAEGRVRRFLAAASASALGFVFLVNPKLGSRDWDLLALPVFPLILYLISRSPAFRRPLRPTSAALLVGAMVLHTGPWIAANADRDRGVAMTLAMVARDPRYDDPRLRAAGSLTLLLHEAGYPNEAERIARRAAAARGGAIDFCNLGKSMGAQGKYDEAIVWFRRALEADPLSSDALYNLAIAHRLKGNPAAAERVLRDGLVRSPRDPAALRLLGTLLGERGEAEEAVAILEQCVAVDTADGDAWERLAILHARAGREDEARSSAVRALRLRPEARGAREVLEGIAGRSGPASR